MKKYLAIVFSLCILLQAAVSFAAPYRRYSSDVYVSGYTRSDGTSVQSHYRSAPDGNASNNYGSWNYKNNSGDNHSRRYGW